LLKSLWRSTQTPLHAVLPGGQAVHTPAVQISVEEHLVPHAPQLFGSVETSMHVPLQFI
jgi:hypothetical protein